MKKLLILSLITLAFCQYGNATTVSAEKDKTVAADSLNTGKKKKSKKTVQYNEKGEIIKTGLNYGPLPAIAFDADRGFQFGALLNIYNFGDGSTYPEPKSQWYMEASAYLKEKRIGTHKYTVAYDNKRITDSYNLRLSAAATLYFDTALSFYGFNGYQSIFDPELSSGFYRHSRTTATLKADFTGEIVKNFYWKAGYHFNWFQSGQYKDFYKGTPNENDPEMTLLELYKEWGIIPEEQIGNAFSSALRVGLMYDTRDVEASPSKGIWAEAHIITSPKFIGSTVGYCKANVTFRHYVPIYKDKVIFAYRLNYQGYLGKNAPWYTLPYYTIVGQNYDYDGIGGYRTVRGIMQNRVQGKHTGFFNAEIRYRFIDFRLWNQNIAFAVSAFCDGTSVFKGIDLTNRTGKYPELYSKFINTSKADGIHLAAGGGLRFIMNKNFIVAFEYAQNFNKQDNTKGSFYINTGFLF